MSVFFCLSIHAYAQQNILKTQTTHSALLNEQLEIQDYKIVYRQGQRSFKSCGRVIEYCKHINDCFREEYT